MKQKISELIVRLLNLWLGGKPQYWTYQNGVIHHGCCTAVSNDLTLEEVYFIKELFDAKKIKD